MDNIFLTLTTIDPQGNRRPEMNGFSRYIGKSGGILIRAYGEADSEKQQQLKHRFPDIDKIWKMCSRNIKQGFCRVVCGAYLLGMTADQIEQMCKTHNIWVDE